MGLALVALLMAMLMVAATSGGASAAHQDGFAKAKVGAPPAADLHIDDAASASSSADDAPPGFNAGGATHP